MEIGGDWLSSNPGVCNHLSSDTYF